MAYSIPYPTWNGVHDGSMQDPPWVTLSEAARPLISSGSFESYYEYESRFPRPYRKFDDPIGPSPEEDKNAPFYVPPRPRTPPGAMYPPHGGLPRVQCPQYRPRDDENRGNNWLPANQMNGQRWSYPQPADHRLPGYRDDQVQPEGTRNNLQYPTQEYRERSWESQSPPPVHKSHRPNTYAACGRRRRKDPPVKRIRSSLEASVSSSPQHVRQNSQEERAPARSISRLTSSSPRVGFGDYSPDRGTSSPSSVALSPFSAPTLGDRSWGGTPAPTTEDMDMTQEFSPNQIHAHCKDKFLTNWQSTGEGPDPYKF